MILNPCSSCGADPYYVASQKLWRCSYCNRAGYVGEPKGEGWNALNANQATGTLSKFDLPARQTA